MNWQENMKNVDNIIARGGSNLFFNGPASEDEIKKSEALIYVHFPDAYKHFLRKYGVGNYFDAEFYGLVHGAVPSDSAPCAIWSTLEERRNQDFPEDFVVIYASGFGPLYCLSTSEVAHGDCPIREWNYASVSRDQNSLVSASFSQFILDKITERAG